MKTPSALLFSTIGILLIALVSPSATGADASDLEQYRTIVRKEYPQFDAQPLVYSTDDYDTDGFVFDDILVGDFNGDSIEDFAAALKRTRSKAEAEKDEHHETRSILAVGAAVVCEGSSDTPDKPRCNYLVEPTLGGLKGELALIEVMSEHLPQSQLSSGENCDVCARRMNGQRTLALVNSYGGYCLNVYYAVAGAAKYNECLYCSD